MATWKSWKLLALSALVTSAAHAGHYYRSRPKCLTGIPCRDYQGLSRSDSRLALSYVGDLIPIAPWVAPARAATGPTAKPAVILAYYQLKDSVVAIDHCSISQFALRVESDGNWSLNLRADQNPFLNPDGTPKDPENPIPNIAKFTSHLKRNEFFVRVRGYGAFNAEAVPSIPFAKPIMFQICPESFWVQRGEPYFYRTRGCCPELKEFFDRVDRIELEFFYH